MTINSKSRYTQGTLTRTPNSEGTYNIQVTRTINRQIGAFSLYVWQQVDRPDLVAAKLLGNPQLWWAIFDVNPEIIYPLNIPAGTVVRIPKGPIMGQGTLFQ
jgi:hypothetical protein